MNRKETIELINKYGPILAVNPKKSNAVEITHEGKTYLFVVEVPQIDNSKETKSYFDTFIKKNLDSLNYFNWTNFYKNKYNDTKFIAEKYAGRTDVIVITPITFIESLKEFWVRMGKPEVIEDVEANVLFELTDEEVEKARELVESTVEKFKKRINTYIKKYLKF